MSGVGQTHGETTKLVCTPGGHDGRLVPVVLVDRDLVVRLLEVDAAEDLGLLDALVERFQGRERVPVSHGLGVQGSIVTCRTLRTVFFGSQVQPRGPGVSLVGVYPFNYTQAY